MKKVLVIVGPTGVGKTALSLELAKKFKGEIISGDSVQVYKGLDIGSAKIKYEQMKGIVHHGIDIRDAKETYSVYDFQKYARKKIDEISSRDKLPIIVGGTGLYIKACIYDYIFNEEADIDTSKYDKYSNAVLYKMLENLDRDSLKNIHINNRKRLIRALTIAENSSLNKSQLEGMQDHKIIYDAYIISCYDTREKIYDLIDKRVLKMVDDGLLQEIEGLLASGVTFEDRSMSAIGYKEWKPYFNHEIDLAQVISLIQRNSRRFAKRQFTWFKNQMDVKWFKVDDRKEIEAGVKAWIEG